MRIKIFAIAFVLMLGFTLWGIIGTLNFLSNATTTTGTIVDYETVKTKNGYGYNPIIEFQTTTGAIVSFKNALGQSYVPYLGSKISVIYNLARPQEARLNDFASIWLLPLAFTFPTLSFGIIFLITLVAARHGVLTYSPPGRTKPYTGAFTTPSQSVSTSTLTSSQGGTVTLNGLPYEGPSKLDAFEQKTYRDISESK